MRSVTAVDETSASIAVRNPELSDRDPPKTFVFDAVYGPGCAPGAANARAVPLTLPRRRSCQRQVYDTTAAPIVGAHCAPRIECALALIGAVAARQRA